VGGGSVVVVVEVVEAEDRLRNRSRPRRMDRGPEAGVEVSEAVAASAAAELSRDRVRFGLKVGRLLRKVLARVRGVSGLEEEGGGGVDASVAASGLNAMGQGNLSVRNGCLDESGNQFWPDFLD
jgi:hypothetical protein